MMLTRFIASMLMHINVEKDLRAGINMMKYASIHSENFTNVHAPFFIAFLLTVSSLAIELNVMLVLTSIPNVLGVIMKYVSLCAIQHLPRFYYGSLVGHKCLKFGGM